MRHQQRITFTPPDASGFVMTRRLRPHRLPLLALLALAAVLLWLTPADSARAQAQGVVWSAKLTVDVSSSGQTIGCDNDSTFVDNCSAALSDDKFRYNGTTYTVREISQGDTTGNLSFYFDDGKGTSGAGNRIQGALSRLTLNVDGTALRVADAGAETGGPMGWGRRFSAWTDGQKVTLSLTAPVIRVTSVEYASSPPNGSYYRKGETLAVAVNFSGPVTAESEDMWVNIDIGGQREVAYLNAGSGTDRWIFTHEVYEIDVDTDGFTVREDRETSKGTQPGAYVVMGSKTEKKYRGTPVSFKLANFPNAGKGSHVVKGTESIPAPGYVSSATCNAAGTHCTVPYGWKPLPKHLREQPGASLRLMYVTDKTLATSTNISAYNTFVKNDVPSDSPLYELRSHIRAMANAQQGADLKTNTRTRAGDPGAWAPIFWVKGHHKKGKVADGYADLFDGSWDSSTVKGGKVSGPLGTLGHEPWVWTGSKSDGSPDVGTGYDNRLGATNSQRGKALTEGQELYADSTYASNDPQGVGETMYAITPILTVSQEPYKPEAPANLTATVGSGSVTLTWDAYEDPKKIWYYQYKWGKYWYEIMGIHYTATSWTLDENYGAWGEGPPYGKPLKNREYTLKIRAVSIDEIVGEAAEIKFTPN